MRRATTGALALAVLLGLAPASWAIGGSTTVRVTTGTCALAAWSSGYGISCTAVSTGTGSVIDLLAGEPVPRCWDEEPEPGFRPPREEDGPGRWWLETCLEGFDPANPVGGARFSHEYVFRAPGAERSLSTRQAAFVDRLMRGARIPLPVLRASPDPTPRVGQDTAFSVPPAYATAQTITLGGQSMRGVMTHLRVYPEGAAGPSVDCPGAGLEAHDGDSPASLPAACWYRYDRPSSGPGAPGGRFRALVVATWTVQRSGDGGSTWTGVGTFTRQAIAPVRVTEVQTLVVP